MKLWHTNEHNCAKGDRVSRLPQVQYLDEGYLSSALKAPLLLPEHFPIFGMQPGLELRKPRLHLPAQSPTDRATVAPFKYSNYTEDTKLNLSWSARICTGGRGLTQGLNSVTYTGGGKYRSSPSIVWGLWFMESANFAWEEDPWSTF